MENTKFINTTSEFIVEKAYNHDGTIKTIAVRLEINHQMKVFSIKPMNSSLKEFGFIQRISDNIDMIVALTRAIEEAAVFAERILSEEK